MKLDSKVPSGPLAAKWQAHRDQLKLVNPSNRRKFTVIVVGTGLAGGAAAASLGEMGYNVLAFTYHDSARRAHSIAAQGGINATKNYRNDGDSTWRLFYDTIKGGDFRAREANVYRLAEVSVNIIDQAVAQGVPFAREYSGLLDNRSFGGAQVARTFYARGQTGQQLLLGAYQALARQVHDGTVKLYPRHEMLDLVVENGRATGIVVRNLVDGSIHSFAGHAVLLCTGGYSNVYYLSTMAKASNATAVWRAYRRGAGFANPSFGQIHPTCIPQAGEHQSKLTLMSESLRNDGRIWVPKNKGEKRAAGDIPEAERDYFLERKYPAFGNLVPRDVASRNAKEVVDDSRGVGPRANGVYLDFSDSIKRLGRDTIEGRYGNLFEMYERITGENPYATPMRIFPAPHYTMGGLWVDYNLMSTIPGLFVLGEANFSDHGANRLGASALMQGLADGYFVAPPAVSSFLSAHLGETVSNSSDAFRRAESEVKDRLQKLLAIQGKRTADSFHRELGRIVWEHCGMSRDAGGLKKALKLIPELRQQFWENLKLVGTNEEINPALESANRVADYFDLAELMCVDALQREESCGCHLRVEYQTEEGEAMRQDDKFSHVSVFEYQGPGKEAALHREELKFEFVQLSQRSYK